MVIKPRKTKKKNKDRVLQQSKRTYKLCDVDNEEFNDSVIKGETGVLGNLIKIVLIIIIIMKDL